MPRLTVILLVLAGGAYAQDSDVRTGREIYQQECVDCHLTDGAGDDIAPGIRGIPENNLRRSMGGLEGMPEFALTRNEQSALLRYLRSLDQ